MCCIMRQQRYYPIHMYIINWIVTNNLPMTNRSGYNIMKRVSLYLRQGNSITNKVQFKWRPKDSCFKISFQDATYSSNTCTEGNQQTDTWILSRIKYSYTKYGVLNQSEFNIYDRNFTFEILWFDFQNQVSNGMYQISVEAYICDGMLGITLSSLKYFLVYTNGI